MARKSFVKVTCRYTYIVLVHPLATDDGLTNICTVGEATLMRRSAADALWDCQVAAEKAATDKMDALLESRKAVGMAHGIRNETYLRSYSWYDTQAPSVVHEGEGFVYRSGFTPWLDKGAYWGQSKGARQQTMRNEAKWAAEEAAYEAEHADEIANTITGVLDAALRTEWA